MGEAATAEYAITTSALVATTVLLPYTCLAAGVTTTTWSARPFPNAGLASSVSVNYTHVSQGSPIPAPQSDELYVEVVSCAHFKLTAYANGVLGEVAVVLELFNATNEANANDCIADLDAEVTLGGISSYKLGVEAVKPGCNGGPFRPDVDAACACQ